MRIRMTEFFSCLSPSLDGGKACGTRRSKPARSVKPGSAVFGVFLFTERSHECQGVHRTLTRASQPIDRGRHTGCVLG